jgi:hypothetical protein
MMDITVTFTLVFYGRPLVPSDLALAVVTDEADYIYCYDGDSGLL